MPVHLFAHQKKAPKALPPSLLPVLTSRAATGHNSVAQANTCPIKAGLQVLGTACSQKNMAFNKVNLRVLPVACLKWLNLTATTSANKVGSPSRLWASSSNLALPNTHQFVDHDPYDPQPVRSLFILAADRGSCSRISVEDAMLWKSVVYNGQHKGFTSFCVRYGRDHLV